MVVLTRTENFLTISKSSLLTRIAIYCFKSNASLCIRLPGWHKPDCQTSDIVPFLIQETLYRFSNAHPFPEIGLKQRPPNPLKWSAFLHWHFSKSWLTPFKSGKINQRI
jgi:hypothetical protein